MRKVLWAVLFTCGSVLFGGAAQAQQAVTVEADELLLDGQPFKVHGLQLMTYVAPLAYLEDPPADSCARGREPPCPFRAYINANARFGTELLNDAKAFGANTILFKVAEPGLDEEDPVFSQAYIDDIVEGVRLTREQGFVVIICIQENRVSGEPGPPGVRSPIPDAGTLRAALRLAELFGSDPGVMIELYGEPYAKGRVRVFWDYYINGGKEFTGVNTIIQAMRDAGAKNVILVEPLSQDFTMYPGGITDPLGQVAYGIHAYFSMVGTTTAEWDKHYGDFAASHPVIITEWNQNTSPVGDLGSAEGSWCETASMDLPRQAFEYFNEKGIDGVVAWAFDLPTTIVRDFKGTPRTLEGFKCGESGGGIGVLLQQYFDGALPAAPAEAEPG